MLLLMMDLKSPHLVITLRNANNVLPSLRRRLKQLMRGKAMRSTTWAKKRRLNQRESATHARKGDTWHSCPLGNNSKPISIDDNVVLRKDGNGTSLVAIAKHPTTHTKAMPKYIAPNLRRPKLAWVPSKSGWMCRYHGIGGLIPWRYYCSSYVESSIEA
jgi:hypothetical protein